MVLQPGARLGPYEIQSAIGAGGMGEVYKARDTRLDRTVAIKILPPQLADDPSFRERFDREARAISQLDHPHICALHDVGDQSGTSFLVMQYLEGETLAGRLAKGPLPIGRVLEYAAEIADALANAHRHGVVHRDLKPGNIILTKEGTKLLDFGLAKVGQPMAPAASNPALTAMATFPPDGSPLTMQGTILGTLQYMSPEQLEGKDADARADIFAFGAIVYEMATGRRAFEGKSQVSLIAAILDHDPPPISASLPVSPPLLDHVVKTCLQKNPDKRWQSMADVLIELQLIAKGGGQAAPAFSASRGKRQAWVAWTVAGALLIMSIGLGAALVLGRKPPVPVKVSFDVDTGPTGSQFHFALSPDGKHLVAIGSSEKGTVLWHRALDDVNGQIMPGTEGAQFPFWSPDSRFIAFFTAGKLKKIDLFGAPAQTLCDASVGRGGTWNAEGVIVFAPYDSGPLFHVSAAGGSPVQWTEMDQSRQQIGHRHPYFLPDGRHFLYTVLSTKTEYSGVYVGSLDSKESKQLVNSAVKAVFAPPEHILFVRESTLMAQRIDPERFELRGDPFSVAEEVGSNATNSAAGVAVSNVGVLAYRRGTLAERVLLWSDRSGKQTPAYEGRSTYQNPALSPDATRVAVSIQEGATTTTDIWILDLARAIRSRLTFDSANDTNPIWSPDGTRIVFSSNRNGTFDLYEKNSAGVGQETLVLKTSRAKIPNDWSLDGRFILYSEQAAQTGLDLWVLPTNGVRTPQPVMNSPFTEMHGRFSPDGRWIAYVANESGVDQVYVQSFPSSGSKWQISSGGGYQPRWSRDGKELFFISAVRDAMVAAINISPAGIFSAGAAQKLFAANPAVLFSDRNTWEVTPDGQRFIVNSAGPLGIRPVTVVVNWNVPGQDVPR